MFTEAYNLYIGLDETWRDRVHNVERLISCMEGFHLYRANLIRSTMQEINADSVKNTDVLERLYLLNSTLTSEQRALLTSNEVSELASMMVVYDVIIGIQNLTNDAIEYYNTLPSIQNKYSSLTDKKKELVYNYSDIDRIDEIYALQSNLLFEVANGGYAVRVKSDCTSNLSGNVEIPATYKGQPVTTIPERGFSGCSNVTSFVVPDSVTLIEQGAFSGCIKLQSITLPFVGTSRTDNGYSGRFGYIFGGTHYEGSIAVQYPNASSPMLLPPVIITSFKLLGT